MIQDKWTNTLNSEPLFLITGEFKKISTLKNKLKNALELGCFLICFVTFLTILGAKSKEKERETKAEDWSTSKIKRI